MASWYTRAGNALIQWGYVIKNQVDIRISFPAVFGSIPAVVITSEWPNAGVGFVDTIHDVTGNGFSVHSGNQAPNYWVNWTAIGLPAGLTALTPEMEEVVQEFQKLTQAGAAVLTKESPEQGSGQVKGAGEGKT